MFILIPPNNLKTCPGMNERVMKRVRFVFYTRKVLNPVVMECCAVAALGVTVGKFASLSKVIENSPSVSMENVTQHGVFWTKAFRDTELPVQAILISIIILGSILVVQIVRLVKGNMARKQSLSRVSGLLEGRLTTPVG